MQCVFLSRLIELAMVNYLVFSDDFGEHPSSCQHIFLHSRLDAQVLWVNTIGMRKPSVTARDFRKIFLKSKKMLHGLLHRATAGPLPGRIGNIYVMQPVMLPFITSSSGRLINKFLVCTQVNRRLRKLGIKKPILIITAPNAGDYLGHFDERKIVYYCVDDFSNWPGLSKELVASMEDTLARRADVVIATSKKLCDKITNYGKSAHLLTHGVDYNFFQNAVCEHQKLRDIPQPRVGYFGLFDRRSDLPLLAAVAGRLPDVSFVITGNVEVDTSILKNIKNIYFTGPVPYKELPSMAFGWEACILPYLVNELSASIMPLKLKEYLATGKAVVSTPIKEAELLADYLYLADGEEEWAAVIRRIIRGTHEHRTSVDPFLLHEAWPYKADQFFKYVSGNDTL